MSANIEIGRTYETEQGEFLHVEDVTSRYVYYRRGDKRQVNRADRAVFRLSIRRRDQG